MKKIVAIALVMLLGVNMFSASIFAINPPPLTI